MTYLENHNNYAGKINGMDLPKELLNDLSPGMLSMFDRKAFYYAAKERFAFEGLIVDAGAFIGGTANCFSRGILDNPKRPEEFDGPIIYSYDQFKVIPYIVEFFKKYKIDYRLEESFRPEFEKNTSKYSDLIQIEDGNILEKKWDKGKFIEILGVDAAKGTRLVKYFMTELYPNLAAGKSTLLFQDYIFFRHPSLIVSIGMLEDHLERLCEGVYTVVYKVIKDITLNDVTSLLEKYKDRDSQLELMDQAVNLCVKRHHAAVVSLAHVTLIKQLESIEAAERKLNDVKRKYRSEFENNPFCKHQLFLSQELVANKILRLDEFLTPL